MGFAKVNQPIQEAPRRRRLIIKEQTAHRSAAKKFNRWKLSFLFIVLACISLSVLSLSRFAQVTQLQAKTQELSKGIVDLKAERDYLVMNLEPYKASSRIEQLAKINLGMDYPDTAQVHYVDSNFSNRNESQTDMQVGFMNSFSRFFSAVFNR